MNEEEKEAIKYLEFLSNEKCECEACQRAKKEYKTILNLLDKQKNEIEEKTTILLAGSKKVKQLEKEIEELKENELLEITENFVSKDKIKEIIENAEADIDYLTHDLIEDLEKLLEENDE